MNQLMRHVIVMGGSTARLLAVHVISDHLGQVTVFDPSTLPGWEPGRFGHSPARDVP